MCVCVCVCVCVCMRAYVRKKERKDERETGVKPHMTSQPYNQYKCTIIIIDNCWAPPRGGWPGMAT